jgi:hypothetical protein
VTWKPGTTTISLTTNHPVISLQCHPAKVLDSVSRFAEMVVYKGCRYEDFHASESASLWTTPLLFVLTY